MSWRRWYVRATTPDIALSCSLTRKWIYLPPPRRDGPLPAAGRGRSPIATATRYLLNNGHREAESIGHHQVDSIHLLLALLYNDSRSTSELLQKAGVSMYAVRAYLSGPGPYQPGNAPPPTAVGYAGSVGVSPVFLIPLGAMLIGGAGLFLGAPVGADPAALHPLRCRWMGHFALPSRVRPRDGGLPGR